MLYLALFCLNIFQFTPRYPSAEVEIVNAEMMDPSEKVAFRWHYNRLEVKGLDFHTNFIVTTSRDTLRNDYSNTFGYIAPTSKTDTIRVVLNGKIIHEEVFEIWNMPKPAVRFGYISENQDVSLQYILSNPGLHVFNPVHPMKTCVRIQMFEAKIIKKNGKEIPLTSKSPKGFDDWSDRKQERYWNGQFVFHRIENDVRNYLNKFDQNHLKLLRKMEIGDQLVFGMGVFSCPSCKQSKRNINLTLTVGSK